MNEADRIRIMNIVSQPSGFGSGSSMVFGFEESFPIWSNLGEGKDNERAAEFNNDIFRSKPTIDLGNFSIPHQHSEKIAADRGDEDFPLWKNESEDEDVDTHTEFNKSIFRDSRITQPEKRVF